MFRISLGLKIVSALIVAGSWIAPVDSRASACSELAIKRIKSLRASAMQKAADAEHEKEFPNLFLPKKFRGTPEALLSAAEKKKLAKSVVASRNALNKALAAVFERLTIPLKLPGETDPRSVRFFELANKIAHDVDPSVKIVPSGGVVRSALGMIYEDLLKTSEKDPNFDVIKALKEIALGKGAIYDAKGNLMSFDLRGVGSDFDILMKGGNAETRKEITSRIGDLFKDSKFTHQEIANDKLGLQKAFFTIADVKDLDKQIDRSARQGGAALDLLYYDHEKRALVEPPGMHGIIDDFIKGEYRYLPAKDGVIRESPMKNALRGPRSEVEIPFLKINAQDREVLNDELRSILKGINFGRYPDENTIKQILKLQRNARLSQGNNRIAQAPANTTLGLLRSIANALEKKRIAQLIEFPSEIRIFSYTPRYALSPERLAAAQSLPAEARKFLLTSEDFIHDHSADGFLFHGTSFEGALGAPRGGYRQTEYEIGMRRGTFLSNMREMSESFAKRYDPGYVLRLILKKDKPFLVFDQRGFDGTAAFKKLSAEAKTNNMEIADLLAKKYGIDLIILAAADKPTVFLLKNSDILENFNLPALAKDTVESINRLMSDAKPNIARLLADRKLLEEARPIFKALDIDIGSVPSLPEVITKAKSVLPNVNDPREVVKIYSLLPEAEAAALPQEALRGKSYGSILAEAMGLDPELAIEVNAHGFLSSKFRSDVAIRSPDWAESFHAAMKTMRDSLLDPKQSPESAYTRLDALGRLFGPHGEGKNFVSKEAQAELINSIPAAVYDRVIAGAIKNPMSFPGINDVQTSFNSITGNKINLIGPLMADRVKNIRASNNIHDKLTQVNLISWSNFDFFENPNSFPELSREIKALIPKIDGDELKSGNITLIQMLYNLGSEPVDSNVIQLTKRMFDYATKNAPTSEALSGDRDLKSTFEKAVAFAMKHPDEIDPELGERMSEAIDKYGYYNKWPGLFIDLQEFQNRFSGW